MNPFQQSLLVVDPNPDSAEALSAVLAELQVEATRVGTQKDALHELARRDYSGVAVCVQLPDASGLELLSKLGQYSEALPVVVITDQGKTSLGVKAVRMGANDFLCRPFEEEEVKYVIQKMLSLYRAGADEPPKSARLSLRSNIIGTSPVMVELERTIHRVADGVATVLIRGESGTGKELVARRIHDESPRKDGPFIKVHCGALPDNLLESELFGYEKGAFTGATQRKPGRVELAEGGTLFLDEIGDITPAIQVKLLRVLQEREYERLGGTQTLQADVRFVAATHRDLDGMVRSGDFREDLFYRLSVVPLFVPPLRARPDDIAELAMHFARTAGLNNGRTAMGIDAPALEMLRSHRWPGNVRQLQNFIERLVLLADGPRISARDCAMWQPGIDNGAVDQKTAMAAYGAARTAPESAVSEALAPESEDVEVVELATAIARAEKLALERALKKAGGNRNVAARMLGVSRRTLYYKLNEHGVS
ncbi:MAG: sigma-54-dependent Fis family transcriptional regulator [Polyangiaceae bacterium]|nr:sigma-54-dependent Fis family transcriptional regulator [Myxococcales bacterium]MCB9588769.1 sigma-54-dependent Fis family transcriptional regulator [Polyangiaceae bacterium]MCB9605327.1 sigma-54-dependent Fis family transcriptional regulator [Polyangiaceae bacterium]